MCPPNSTRRPTFYLTRRAPRPPVAIRLTLSSKQSRLPFVSPQKFTAKVSQIAPTSSTNDKGTRRLEKPAAPRSIRRSWPLASGLGLNYAAIMKGFVVYRIIHGSFRTFLYSFRLGRLSAPFPSAFLSSSVVAPHLFSPSMRSLSGTSQRLNEYSPFRTPLLIILSPCGSVAGRHLIR